jgi:hypothetical protein
MPESKSTAAPVFWILGQAQNDGIWAIFLADILVYTIPLYHFIIIMIK